MTGYDALIKMCAGFTSETIAMHLISENGIWVGKDLANAAARVRACLNPKKPAYFSMSELIAVMAFTKCYEPIFYMCEQLGLSEPNVLDQTIVLNRIEEKTQGVLAQLNELFKQVEMIKNEPSKVHSVAGARFSREGMLHGDNVVVSFSSKQ